MKERNGSEFRIRDNLTNTLTRKFVETMKDYQNAQSKYKAFVQKKVVRQVHIVKPEATAGECGWRDGGWVMGVLMGVWSTVFVYLSNENIPPNQNTPTEEIDVVMRSGGADQFLTQAILKVR